MGTLKIELDVPEFKDNLEISLTLKRDGENIIINNTENLDTSLVWKQNGTNTEMKQVSTWKQSPEKPVSSGNLMGANLDDF